MSDALPDYAEALSIAVAVCPDLGIESCAIGAAMGRILAEEVAADRDWPPFDRATMDGYALRAADVGKYESYRVIGVVAAGSETSPVVGAGQAVKIATGAPLPRGADGVIPHEKSDRGEPVRFSVNRVEPWSNVHRRGCDANAGSVVLRAGMVLGAQHIGVAAGLGRVELKVRRRPRVAILTTGDEVRPVGAEILPHQIRNSNGPMLTAAIAAMGGAVVSVEHVPDNADATLASVRQTLDICDLLLTVGGVSAGDRDFIPGACAALGVRTMVHGASIQPGRPIFVAVCNPPTELLPGRVPRRVTIVGLPGNPVSVLATVHLFAWPMIRRMTGLSPALPWKSTTLAKAARPNPNRRAFRPSRIEDAGHVSVLDWSGSGDLIHTIEAHGLVELPAQAQEVPAGSSVRFLPWAWGSIPAQSMHRL